MHLIMRGTGGLVLQAHLSQGRKHTRRPAISSHIVTERGKRYAQNVAYLCRSEAEQLRELLTSWLDSPDTIWGPEPLPRNPQLEADIAAVRLALQARSSTSEV